MNPTERPAIVPNDGQVDSTNHGPSESQTDSFLRTLLALVPRVIDLLLATRRIKEGLELITTAYHVRTFEQADSTPIDEGLRSQREALTARRACAALQRRMPFVPPILRLELFDHARVQYDPAKPTQGLPSQVYGERLRDNHWNFGPSSRARALEALCSEGYLVSSMRRWYARTPSSPSLLPEYLPFLHLSRFLGSLDRTVYQGFERLEGSFLWVLRFERAGRERPDLQDRGKRSDLFYLT